LYFLLNQVNEEEEEEENYELKFIEKYYSQKPAKLKKQEIGDDGKIVRQYENGKREVIFPSGVRKEIFDDGFQSVYFVNKDIKQVKLGPNLIRFFQMVNRFTILMNQKQHKPLFPME
jgi:hypothetical protein